MILRKAAIEESASAISARLRGATALHTTTHRRSPTSARGGHIDYGLGHSRPGGRLRGGGRGRGGLQSTAAAGDLDGTDADLTRASRQRGAPQPTHIEKDRGRSKRKELAVKSRATGFPCLVSNVPARGGSPSSCPPFGAHKSSLSSGPSCSAPRSPLWPSYSRHV